MEDIGYNDDLKTASRRFHVQTATLVDEGIIRTEVFEKGRVLFVENYYYERRSENRERGAEGRLRYLVDQFHQSMMEEIDSLFEMSERVNDSDSVSAHEKIGLVFLYMHIFDKAESHFRRAIAMAPERHSTYIYLGRCFYRQKRYKEALAILNELVEQGVAYPDLFNQLGLVMLDRSNYRQALNYFKEALKLNPAYIEAYLNLSEAILRRMTRLDPATQKADLAKSISFLQIIFKKIDTYGRAEDRKQCAAVMKILQKDGARKALALMSEYRDEQFVRRTPPEIVGFRFQLRLLYSEDEMSDDLLASYERKLTEALERNPSYPDLWHYLALVHLMQCRHHFLMGLDNFRDASRINPNFDRAIKNLRLVENDGREFLSLIKTIV